VVRGDDLDPDVGRHQAEAFLRRFPDWGRYGLSAFYARNEAEVDDLAGGQLERFPLLGLFRVADLEENGFNLVPTFRQPPRHDRFHRRRRCRAQAARFAQDRAADQPVS
jgi:hypothetical protein